MWVNQYTAGWPEWVIILVAIFGIIFSVMWILLPFAVSSILGKASKQLKVSEEILYELNRLNNGSDKTKLANDRYKEPKI